jgi:hypothetical protein
MNISLTGIVAAALALGTPILTSTQPKPPDIKGYTASEEGAVGVTATRPNPEDDSTVTLQDKYLRADGYTCSLYRGLDLTGIEKFLEGCPEGQFPLINEQLDCDPGAVELAALWVQRVDAAGDYGDAELVEEGGCVTPQDLAAEVERAFAELQIPTPEATIQARRPLLVNIHYPVQANAEAVEEQVTLLDVPVLIRAEPTEYRWDFDDPHKPGGGTLTTTDAGHRWQDGQPDPDESWTGYTYTHLGDPDTDPGTMRDDEGDWYRDDVTITVDTTWTGRFQLVGTSTWTDIDGTITTTSTIEPFRVTEARVRLVCTDLNGNSSC